MISVDTNIVVRLLAKDDLDQFHQSSEIFSTQEIFIPDTVILETEWVLRYAYKFKPVQITDALKKLFGLANVNLEDATEVALAIEWYEAGFDFADALHLAKSQNCQQMLTFDRRFVSRSKRITSCPVRMPDSLDRPNKQED
jgi:predicted nucleic-acid-binding protein